MRSHDREVSHPNALLGPFLDDGHARYAIAIVRKSVHYFPQEATVDLVDDLEVAGQKALEERHRPALECFWQERVIRVAEGANRLPPRRVPWHVMDVDEHAHELGDRDRRMRIVELDRDFRG